MEKFEHYKDWKKAASSFLGDEFWLEFRDFFHVHTPLVNMYETTDELICVIHAPGKQTIHDWNISVHQQELFLSGEIEFGVNGYKMLHEEMSPGPFRRKVTLPYPVRNDKVDAVFKNGMLFVYLYPDRQTIHAQQPIPIKTKDASL